MNLDELLMEEVLNPSISEEMKDELLKDSGIYEILEKHKNDSIFKALNKGLTTTTKYKDFKIFKALIKTFDKTGYK